jgi:hypothetical protein
MSDRRTYPLCAKCLRPAQLDPGSWVCSNCAGTPGAMNGCAVCGRPWNEPSRAYVCDDHLARPVKV